MILPKKWWWRCWFGVDTVGENEGVWEKCLCCVKRKWKKRKKKKKRSEVSKPAKGMKRLVKMSGGKCGNPKKIWSYTLKKKKKKKKTNWLGHYTFKHCQQNNLATRWWVISLFFDSDALSHLDPTTSIFVLLWLWWWNAIALISFILQPTSHHPPWGLAS